MSEGNVAETVSVQEAAKILTVSGSMVSHYLRDGKLTATKVGRGNRIPLAEVEALKEKKAAGGLRRGKRKPTEATPAALTQSEAPAQQMAPPTPVTPPPSEALTEVQVGSVIELGDKAIVWRLKMDVEPPQWEQVNTEGISVKVTERKESNGLFFLMCKAAGSESLFSISENDVLNGTFKLLQRPVPIPQVPPTVSGAPPAAVEPEPEASSEPTVDPAKEEEERRREEFRVALEAYVPANELKLRSAMDFKNVDKEHRGTIWGYLLDFGDESEEGKNDRVVEDFGHRSILTFTAGRPVIQRDVVKIVAWALENNHQEVLTYGIDTTKWDALKETGEVPPEFIASVESMKKLDDQRKLVINRLKGEE